MCETKFPEWMYIDNKMIDPETWEILPPQWTLTQLVINFDEKPENNTEDHNSKGVVKVQIPEELVESIYGTPDWREEGDWQWQFPN